MTETCHLKFTEKFENQNYIIYIGVITATFAVLFIYRFHFVAVVLSYVLGCLVCHYGLNSNFLQKYIQKFRCQSSALESQEEHDSVLFRGCGTCGSKECTRHDMSIPVEPWVGLQIHKQLDQAIEDFYNTILDQFVNSWYSKITHQPFFVDELRYQLRYASSCLLKRALKVDYPRFLTERLIPCALMHYRTCIREPHVTPHPAAANRTAEMRYLTSISEVLMPLLLRPTETQNSVFRVLIREIFAKWVLLSLTDVLADPYILNALIILATGDETMAQLPPTPNYKVEFLERFGRRTESAYARRGALLAAELDALVADQEHFYALMQFLKAANHIHLLQFYKDISMYLSYAGRRAGRAGGRPGTLLRADAVPQGRQPHPPAAVLQGHHSSRPPTTSTCCSSTRTSVCTYHMLAAELDALVADQEHFYALMQFLKAANHIHLLQFYKDISMYLSYAGRRAGRAGGRPGPLLRADAVPQGRQPHPPAAVLQGHQYVLIICWPPSWTRWWPTRTTSTR
ncbi:hypothetical protein ACJJTC_018385 [Scirpophaga incertulas]